MLRRSLVFLAAVSAAAAVASPALGITVFIRVEGVATTIFGANEPVVEPFVGTLVGDDGTPVTLDEPTPLGALEAASREAEFYYRLKSLSFGPFVDRIGRHPSAGSSGWVYKVNGVSPPVGAAARRLKEGDRVLWYFARFGPKGGPATLEIALSKGCLVAQGADDNGKRSRVRDVVFHLDSGAVRSRSGRVCPLRWNLARVTKHGLVPSALLAAG